MGVLAAVVQGTEPVYAEGSNYASQDATNIDAIVHDLNDIKVQSRALSRLDEMVSKWSSTNYAIFSPTVDGLLSMIGWGGLARWQSQHASDILVKIHSVALPRLIEATRSPEDRLRWASAQILGAIRPVESTTIDALTNLTTDRDAYVRRVGYVQLIGLSNQVPNFIPLFLSSTNDPDPFNRLTIYKTLVKMTRNADLYVPLITSYLTNGDAFVRSFAVATLGDCGLLASNTYPQLFLALKNGDAQMRIYAAGSLIYIGATNSEVVNALNAALKSDVEREVRRSVAGSLGGMGSVASNAVPTLIEILHQADTESRMRGTNSCTGWWVAARCLGEIGGDEALKGLKEALHNSDPDIRLTANQALTAIKSREQ